VAWLGTDHLKQPEPGTATTPPLQPVCFVLDDCLLSLVRATTSLRRTKLSGWRTALTTSVRSNLLSLLRLEPNLRPFLRRFHGALIIRQHSRQTPSFLPPANPFSASEAFHSHLATDNDSSAPPLAYCLRWVPHLHTTLPRVSSTRRHCIRSKVA